MMSIPDLIRKKQDGLKLSDDEIKFFIKSVSNGNIQESQTGAMLMAIWIKGMVATETMALTQAMVSSGEVMSWPSEWAGLVVDKHSTGGVGDKVSLVLAPALAACGCKVPMISGRGLGHTGGTLDKLESIPGFNIHQSTQQVQGLLDRVGCCIVGQTETLVPADRVLYSTRSITSTVDSLHLITSSILSKKAVESLDALVLDIKFGKAAFQKDLEGARKLARSLVGVANKLGMRTGAVLSRMDAVIGRCAGNSLEVIESLETLKGRGPEDLMELVTTLGGMLLLLCGKASSQSVGSRTVLDSVRSGAALARFQAMMEEQGVTKEAAQELCSTHCDYHRILRRANHQVELQAHADGVVLDIDGLVLAEVLHQLGAGRSVPGEPINHSVGAELLVSLGQRVEKGTSWLLVHADVLLDSEQSGRLQSALSLGAPVHAHMHAPHSLIVQSIYPE